MAHDWKITLFIVNKNCIAKQNRSTSETGLVESLTSSVPDTRFLKEENQDNAHESNANENDQETLK